MYGAVKFYPLAEKYNIKPILGLQLKYEYNGYTSNKQYVKCASPVGSVLARLHPHGDSSVYDALVHLAQPWIMRYPLIDFHGKR